MRPECSRWSGDGRPFRVTSFQDRRTIVRVGVVIGVVSNVLLETVAIVTLASWTLLVVRP